MTKTISTALMLLISAASLSAQADIFPGQGNLAKDKGFGVHGLIPEQSSFADVLKVFGPAKFKSEGDASTSYTSICYFSKDKRQVLMFGANELHGGGGAQDHKKQIFGDITIKYTDVRDLGLCSQTQASFAFMNGMALGQKSERFSRVLGEPSQSNVSNAVGYQFEQHDDVSGFYQDLSVDYFVDTQDRAERISIGQTTTN